MEFHIHADIGQLNKALAGWLTDHIRSTLLKQDRYTIALSGGNTPKAFYQLLASDYSDKIDWQKLHIFFDDERYVPFNDERNNAKMVYESLLNKVNIPAEQIHVMRTDVPPKQSAEEYEKILHRYFDDEQSTFDLVLLGMGDDGHTLSLFPGTKVIHETTKWVSEVPLDDNGNYRITLTAPVVNLASTVAFFVAGEGKANTLIHVLNRGYQPDKYPSQIIRPVSKNLHWFIDEAAAKELRRSNL